MAMLNVNRSIPDPFYRYKMPSLIAKVEGKGNGIKTVIVNMSDIAKSLCRPPTYPTKYFGCELGAQTQMDLKNDRFIVNGAHEGRHLQDVLDGFIKKFVLCPGCDNPETNLHVNQKRQIISERCIACGYQGMVDMKHKLTTYILKNPPADGDQQGTAANVTTKGGKKKEEKQKLKAGKKGKKGSEQSNGDHKEDSNSPVQEISDGYDDWGEDTTDEAIAKRMEELTNGAKGMTMNEDLEKTPSERVDLFFNCVKAMVAKNDNLTGEDAKNIIQEAERLDVRDKAPLVLCEILFNANMAEQITKFRIVFVRLCHGNAKAQKYLLGGVEQIINAYKTELLPKISFILKSFYDNDILEEEILLEWGKKPSKKYVSKELSAEIIEKAKPLLKWLQEAEEEESDEEEEDVEVVYSTQPGIGNQLRVEKVQADNGSKDDDLDIDAI